MSIESEGRVFNEIARNFPEISLLRVGSIEAEFLRIDAPGPSTLIKSVAKDPGIPEHVKEALQAEREIEENLLPDEING